VTVNARQVTTNQDLRKNKTHFVRKLNLVLYLRVFQVDSCLALTVLLKVCSSSDNPFDQTPKKIGFTMRASICVTFFSRYCLEICIKKHACLKLHLGKSVPNSNVELQRTAGFIRRIIYIVKNLRLGKTKRNKEADEAMVQRRVKEYHN
jgi:hypothetical protein